MHDLAWAPQISRLFTVYCHEMSEKNWSVVRMSILPVTSFLPSFSQYVY